jgi:alpha-N-arabinofuranosidase
LNTSNSVQLTLHPEFPAGNTDPRLFGSFVEHLWRAVYWGIYKPEHPIADEQDFRTDVLKMVRELMFPTSAIPAEISSSVNSTITYGFSVAK